MTGVYNFIWDWMNFYRILPVTCIFSIWTLLLQRDITNIFLISGYIKEAIPVIEFKNIENHTIIGNTCYVKYKNFMLDKSLNVRKHLRYNTREFVTKKPVILTSEKGDISIIANKRVDFNGIIYAPNGTVTITGYDVIFGG